MAQPGSRFVQDEPEGVEREKKCKFRSETFFQIL